MGDVFHGTEATMGKKEVNEYTAAKMRCPAENVVTFGFKTKFGGGRSTGFCLIYDNMDSLKKFEPTYRLRRSKLAPERATDKTRKIKKEIKVKKRKMRGTEKAKVSGGQKKK